MENRLDNFGEVDGGHINLQWLKQEMQATCMRREKPHV